METDAKAASWSELFSSGLTGRILLLSFGVWLHAADELMVSTITPAMIASIGGELYVAWLIALYEVGSIVSGAASAIIVLRFGVRFSMAGAALAYFGGCLVSGLAPDMTVMLAGRLIQGLGGGAMIALSFVGVYRLIPEHLTARVYALMSIVWGVSAFSGPMIGAAFADNGIWRGAFYLFAGQAILFALVVMVRMKNEAPASPSSDAVGRSSPLLIVRILVLAAGVVLVAASGTVAAPMLQLILAASGFAALAVFLMLDSASGRNRLLPSRAFDYRQPQGAVIILVLFMAICTMGLITYGPLILTRLHGLSATAVGIILMLESIGWSVTAVLVAGIAPRRQPFAILAGFGAVLVSLAILAYAMVEGPVLLVAACSLVQGAGFGAAWAFMIRRANLLAPQGEGERVASAIPTLQRFGYAIGAACAGIIANAHGFGEGGDQGSLVSREAMASASHAIFLLSLLPAGIGVWATWRFVSFRLPAPLDRQK
ncbi:MAG: MFS transporter [Nitratireductor sp.]